MDVLRLKVSRVSDNVDCVEHVAVPELLDGMASLRHVICTKETPDDITWKRKELLKEEHLVLFTTWKISIRRLSDDVSSVLQVAFLLGNVPLSCARRL